MKKKFTPAKMVNWFEPRILLQTGIKSLISGLFGNYADRREMQAALDDRETDQQWDEMLKSYRQRDEIWIDFISDTGDGFNATYSVAATASRPELVVNVDGVERKLPRAKLLILGGDQVYPSPTGDDYDNKFKMPFEAALPADNSDPDYPHMYAIPGNHDWYDGLGNFIKIFCQQRWIGNWHTRQSRSYFALPLPHNFWLWATDIQLNEDIDKPQLDYFRNIGKERMQAGDKVILCTAEPAWVYKQVYKNDKSYDRLRFFIENYITGNAAGAAGNEAGSGKKTFRLAVVLTGDLHHYSHYCTADGDNQEADHYISAGGGGAFMHLTHNLPEKLSKLKEEGFRLKKTFPDKKESVRLLAGNLAFPFKNYFFSFILLGAVYLLFFWLLQSHWMVYRKTGYLEAISNVSFYDYIGLTLRTLAANPLASILSIGIIIGFYKFADKKTGNKGIYLLGFLHGLLQCMFIFLLIRLAAEIHESQLNQAARWYWQLVFAAELVAGGGLAGGFLMGLYLFTTDLFFGVHLDESSSSLVGEDYKNFLRLHITSHGLTIYPIGIPKVTKAWEQEEKGEQIGFKGEMPEYHLIEEPIHLKK